MNIRSARDYLVPGCSTGLAFILLLAVHASISRSLKAQQIAPQEVSTRGVEPTFKLQSERNLVTVRVVVRNSKGEIVDNLRQEDFELFDRGKKQTLVQFSMEKPGAVATEKCAPKPSPQETGASGKDPAAFTPSRRFVALYFDDVNTGMSGLTRTRDAANRFLQTSIRPGDQIGVFTASGQKPLDFTDDLAKVRLALADLRPHPLISRDETCGAITPYEAYLIVTFSGVGSSGAGTLSPDHVTALAQMEKVLCDHLPTPPSAEEIRMEAMRVQSESAARSTVALRGIESLLHRMSMLPGQRRIVMISDGFLSQTLGDITSRISDRALHANVVISALDARGLYVGSPLITDASMAGRDMPQDPAMLSLKESLLREEALRSSEAMGTLAQDTGGVLFENNNDLEAGFQRTAANPPASYTLAFSAENLKHDGTFHVLKVTLISARGATVQARKGYYAPKRAEDQVAQEKEDLQDAVFSQNEMQALPIQVNTQFFTIDKTDAEIDVVTHVDLSQVHFRKETDRNVDDLTFVTGLFDQDGHYVTGQQKVLELRLRDVTLEKLLRAGVKVASDFNVKPGTYLVRAVVRDAESGQVSALNRTVQIPY